MDLWLHKEIRQRVMRSLRDKYTSAVVMGWARLHNVIIEKDDDDEWCLSIDDHTRILWVEDVRNGHGGWLGIDQGVENWVFENADTMHTILCDMADQWDKPIWSMLETAYDLSNECSWVLEELLANKLHSTNSRSSYIDWIIPRNVGWIIGNEMTRFYVDESYDNGIGEK